MMKCACGCENNIDASRSRGQTKRFYSGACKQRFYRNKKIFYRNKNLTPENSNPADLRNTIIQGDAQAQLAFLPDRWVQCCVTSPPYYGLRDYGVPDQIGLENTPQEYIAKLVDLFREVRRVLRDDGVLWLNLGDSYAGSGKGGQPSMYSQHWQPTYTHKRTVYPGLAAKQLLGIPWRVALALQADGWYLRSDVVWHKVNCVPESVRDRPTRSHEYVFLLSKQRHYYYDQKAVQEPIQQPRKLDGKEAQREKNRRSVWSIPTQMHPFAHCATMSEHLAELCILAGSHPGDLVFDPFMGAGTTALVAFQHGRDYLGIEINSEYIYLSNERLAMARRGMRGM
jgi:site-specific DNA-methyltransferase (cytosine-N4-specific)